MEEFQMAATVSPPQPIEPVLGRPAESDALAHIIGALQSSVLFSCLSGAELIEMARLVRPFEMAPGLIFMEGDSSTNAYVLVSGRVDISVFSDDGRELLLYRLGPGHLFGETGLLDEQPRSACAIARTHCELISISRRILLNSVAHNPGLALRMIASLSRRLRTADETIKAIGFLDMSARLVRILLAMEQEQEGRGIVRVSQNDLASTVGCMRQSITRTITAWRRMGYVSTGRGYIRILNRRKLQALSRQ
jgi:CRP/FNR family transcriptional regulator, cyclic AMP receptor protein